MGWNDRLPEDPYTPPESFYRDRDDYEAWLEYLNASLEQEQGGLTSQNLDPAELAGLQTEKEIPRRQSILAQLWARINGQKVYKIDGQKARGANQEEDANIPF